MADERPPRSCRRRAGALVVTFAVALAACTTGDTAAPARPATPDPEPSIIAPSRANPPSVLGTPLVIVDPEAGPQAPAQWAGGDGPVPFGRWWSGLASGPGVPALWAHPLLLRTSGIGRLEIAAPTMTRRDDGFRDALVVPALFAELGDAAEIRVVDEGAFHVRFTVQSDALQATVTVVQGSPFLEIAGDGVLDLTIPGLAGLPDDREPATTPRPTPERFDTAVGTWLIGSSDGVSRRVDGDHVALTLDRSALVIGPVPTGAGSRYDQVAETVLSAPLATTEEVLRVDDDGTVHQLLRQHRDGPAGAVAWVLLPHQVARTDGPVSPVATMESARGPMPVLAETELSLTYPAVPILWDAVAAPSYDVAGVAVEDLPPIGTGSYFGAKHTATAMAVHDVLAAAGDDDRTEPLREAAQRSLASLVSPGLGPELRWEPRWGSVVVVPSEFGAGSDLNDHQLQNGYWVAAAASLVAADPGQRPLLEDAIDLLIGDYAGAVVVPQLAGTVSPHGTWSAFEGHSWAAGVGGFGAGNNLESISESSFAWWAAARWFLVTDRPEQAEPLIARLTIESWLTSDDWLPAGDALPATPTRPWSGVVWAGKSDPGTWFDPSDEAALGIRLLPLGPQSFSRYPDSAAVDAAQQRWQWCDRHGDGCGERWGNLLDSDAAVAGRAELPTGPLPEESTTEIVRRWWRAHWAATEVAPGWRCTPGTVVRRRPDGGFVALASNPSPRPLAVTCHDDDGHGFDTTLAAGSTDTIALRDPR